MKLLVCSSLMLAIAVASAQTQEMYDIVFKGALNIPSPPWTAWTSSNTLLIERSGNLEEMDPKTGSSKILASDNSLRNAGIETGFAQSVAHDASGREFAFLSGDSLIVWSAGHASTVDHGDIKDVQFAPDGTRVAYAKDADLYVASLEGKSPTRLTRVDRPRMLNGVLTWVYWEEILGRREIAYKWSPDSSKIAYLQTDESPVEESTFVSYTPRPPKLIHQTYPFAGQPNPKVRAGVMPSSGGPTVWLKPQPYEYVLRIGWTPQGEPWLETMNRAQTRVDLWVANPASGACVKTVTDENPQWVNVTDDIYFVNGGKEILMSSERDGFERIYRFNRSGKLVNAVSPANTSTGRAGWVTAGIQNVDEQAQKLTVLCLSRDAMQVRPYRVGFDGSSLEPLSGEPGTHQTSFSPSGKYFVDTVASLNTPPHARLMAVGGDSIDIMPQVSMTAQLSPGKLTTIPARDGYPLPAILRMPANYTPGQRYPVIVYVYGGPGLPEVSDNWRGLDEQLFTSAGFVYAIVDPRSATLKNENMARAVKGRAVGTAELNDLVDAVHWLKQQPYADPDRFGIWGWSGGGNFTLLALTRTQEFKAGMAGAPVTDWRNYDSFYTETLMGLPDENKAGYDETRRWPDAKNLHGRLLMMYGTDDDNVHPINEEMFLNALIEARKSCELMIYPMRKHGLADEAANETRMRAMLDFFRRSL